MTKSGERRGRRGRQAEAAENDLLVLEATRNLVAVHGADVSVAAIAEEAGVGVGSIYRRYPTKEALFQHLCVMAMDQVVEVAGEAGRVEGPWESLVHYITECVRMRTGVLAPLAGSIDVTPTMLETAGRSGQATERIVESAHSAGVLRDDATSLDISLLIETLSRRTAGMPRDEDDNLRQRLLKVALDGLRNRSDLTPLPGRPPSSERYRERWTHPPQ